MPTAQTPKGVRFAAAAQRPQHKIGIAPSRQAGIRSFPQDRHPPPRTPTAQHPCQLARSASADADADRANP